MKYISKTSEPNSLLRHRAKPYSSFDNISLDDKEELRQSLLSEQGCICCYCTKRIPEKIEKDGRVSYDMKVEHYKSQEHFTALQLSYTNLHGACTGNEGKPKKLQTCDTKKGSLEITIKLLSNQPNCETLLKYNSDGEIRSAIDDVEINRQLNEVLNLNMQSLKDNRQEVYTLVQEKVRNESKKFRNDKASFSHFLEQEKINWSVRTDNKHRPFCMVAIYYLNKKIRQNQS
ncbi:retron system putative HNH endonuclease [Dyadobacter sp. NIV53]|uniref:retron system putative HNH endonuclease n=1 Tax=Dyadobacter sp. NIV53 TaxID=2861765 RepID=UPI001C86C645|nr:retron system putative HNH endonuclease [Dyadobacter sp. NIV53]